jgi:hypothetical protein
MPIIQIRRQDHLQERQWRLLEELAQMDVDSALPPTNRLLQDRPAVLEELRQIEAELTMLGVDAEYGFAAWMIEQFWRAADDASEDGSRL